MFWPVWRSLNSVQSRQYDFSSILSFKKCAVTAMKLVLFTEVQQSVVRHTALDLVICSTTSFLVASNNLGIRLLDTVFLLGNVYPGFSIWTNFLNSGSSTIENGSSYRSSYLYKISHGSLRIHWYTTRWYCIRWTRLWSIC